MSRSDIIKEQLAHPRWTTAIAWATAALMLFMLVLAAMYWPRITSSTDTTEQLSQVQGCRSASNSIVTAYRTDFDVARASRDTEATHLSLLIAEALESVANRDGRLAVITPQIADQRERVRKAEVVVVEATRQLGAAQDQHDQRTLLSLEDVDA